MEHIVADFYNKVEGNVYSFRKPIAGLNKSLLAEQIKSKNLNISLTNSASAHELRKSNSAPSVTQLNDSQAPIEDIKLLIRGQKCPEGYEKMMTFGLNIATDVNRGVQGKMVELCFRRGTDTPITNIILLQEEHGEFLPAGYQIVEVDIGGEVLADITLEAKNSSRVFLCVGRLHGSPITDISFIYEDNLDELPMSYGLVERSPLGTSLKLNKNNRQYTGYFCFKSEPEWIQSLIDALEGVKGAEDEVVRLVPNRLKKNYDITVKSLVNEAPNLNLISAVLRASISYDIPAAMIALDSLCRMVKHIDCQNPKVLSLKDVFVKIAALCIDYSVDVIFVPAMKLIFEIVGASTNGLHPVSLYYIVDAMIKTQYFFNMLPVAKYQPVDYTQIYSKHIGGNHSSSSSLLNSLSKMNLEDIHLMRRMPTLLLDRFSHLANSENNFTPPQPPPPPEGEGEGEVRSEGDILWRMLQKVSHFHSLDKIFFMGMIDELECLGNRIPVVDANMCTIFACLGLVANSSLTKPLRTGRLFNAQLNIKLAALRLVPDLLSTVDHEARDMEAKSVFEGIAFGFVLRWYIVPVIFVHILGNRRLCMEIATALWRRKIYRRHLKAEMQVFIEQIVIPTLDSSYAEVSEKLAMIDMVKLWFGSQSEDLVECYLNFEIDPYVKSWKSADRLINALTTISDRKKVPFTAHKSIQELEIGALRTMVMYLRCLTEISRGNFKDKRVSDRAIALIKKQEAYMKCLPGVFRICIDKGIKHGLRELSNYVDGFDEDAVAIADFLHLHHRELGERNIGQFLGRTGSSDAETKLMDRIRFEFTQRLSFRGRSFEDCLRLFLGRGNFFLPGESQQIERLMVAFARCYIEENHDVIPPAVDEDFIMVLAYSTVMLNTDLHNPNVNRKTKMTEAQFVKQVSYIKEGAVTKAFVEGLYRSIAAYEIKTLSESTIEKPEDLQSGALSLESHQAIAAQMFQQTMRDGVRDATVILAGNRYLNSRSRYLEGRSLPVIVTAFQSMWITVFELVTRVLENKSKYSLDAVHLGYDLLGYAATISVFLDLKTEREAFAGLLAKMQYLSEGRDASSIGIVKGEHLNTEVYKVITCTVPSTMEDILAMIDKTVSAMKEKLAASVIHSEISAIEKKFDGNLKLMAPDREFVRAGDLSKRNRNGKFKKHQFFLFSDVLIYASPKSMTNSKLVLRQMLHLHSMRVREAPTVKFGFEILHPDKSFVVQAKTEGDRNDWFRDLQAEISIFYQRQLGGGTSSEGRSDTNSVDALARMVPVYTSSSSGESETKGSEVGPVTKNEQHHRPTKSIAVIQEAITEVTLENDASVEIHPMFEALSKADLHKTFLKGVNVAKPILASKDTKHKASDQQKLLLYGLFKQGTKGDCDINEAPPVSDAVAYSKFKVWERLHGTDMTNAKKQFLSLITELVPGWHENTPAA